LSRDISRGFALFGAKIGGVAGDQETGMKRILWIGALVGLGIGMSACADPAAEQARLDAVDNQNCIDLGFKPGTEPYGNCRLKLKEIRAKDQGTASPNVNFGFGLGVSKGF
jgi:hypothetical protein